MSDPDDDPVARLHPLLARRSSPTAFAADDTVDDATLATLLDAARWAPSAGNSQPWAFVTGRRGDDVHARVVRHLAPSSRAWATDAAVLVVNLWQRFVEDSELPYSEFGMYDLGQAVAHLTVQAQALGLAVRQLRAFDLAGVRAEFAVPAHWEVATMAAVGRPAATGATRTRRPREDVDWTPTGG